MKRILNIIITALLATGVVFLFVFANQKQHDVICPSFEINIVYNNAPQLIDKTTVRNLITEHGIKIKGKSVASIPATRIQKLINRNPYVKKATVSVAVNGVVKATILQRNPLVRVIDMNNNQCLIDHDGAVMPINPYFPVRLVVANGNIESTRLLSALSGQKLSRKLPEDLNNIYIIAGKLEKDTLTSALIEQIYINDKKEIELIPKIGDQSIIVGDTLLLNDKLRNLKIFYSEGMKNLAWNNYKEINLKYKNQVVCSK
ncbi:MAG TPA: hypothetical protein VK172_12390 [Lentimicrobium sp.]|nr:hypothetical protein [Lentimicrobium sp.]